MKPIVKQAPNLTVKEARVMKLCLLACLKKIARSNSEDKIEFYPMLITEGICNNIKFLLMDSRLSDINHEMVLYQFAECCHRMGLDREYPVAALGTSFNNNKNAYRFIENKWIGFYGETRKSLVTAMIKTLDVELWGRPDERNFLTRAKRLWEMGEPIWLIWVILWVIGLIGAYALYKCVQILFYQLSALTDVLVRFVSA